MSNSNGERGAISDIRQPQPPPRLRTDGDFEAFTPVHVVWELTLACNLKCTHCGSRAGKRRPSELTTEEALGVVDQIARLGTRELSLIGGEAYLRSDWTQIVAAATAHGIYCAMQTGARALTQKRLQAGIAAGLGGLGVSLDGLAQTHDGVRGVDGSFDFALLTLQRAKAAGLHTSVNTVISARTMPELPDLLEQLVAVGIGQWQLQLLVPMGNAVDDPELLLQPYQLLELMPLLARLHHEARRRGIVVIPGNNIGYFGPYEHLWRTEESDRGHYAGCSAGQTVIGLESDGTVKGCPSLPTIGYAAGNIHDSPLESIWNTASEGTLRPDAALWGFCGSCYYADVCRGGCTWASHSLLGRPGNNPYCHHRALELQAQGRRERVVKVQDAADTSFAIGRFELVEEAIDGTPLPKEQGQVLPLTKHEPHAGGTPSPHTAAAPAPLRPIVPLRLERCYRCNSFVKPEETTCPFCRGDRAEIGAEHERWVQRIQRVMDEVRRLLPHEGRALP